MGPIDVRSLVLGAEPLSAEEIAATLVPYRFADPARADRNIQALAERHPSREAFAEVLPRLLEAAALSADPDAALDHFRTYAEARIDSHAFFDILLRIPDLLNDLMRIFGGSDYLSAILIRHPDYLTWLLETDARDSSKSRGALEAELRQWIAIFESPEAREGILRRFKRRETLRIGMRDLLGVATVEQTTREMAYLADVTFQIAYELARESLDARHGRPLHEDGTPAGYAIIGMGKLGGEELNFSSDVDVLCVYSDEGKTTKGVPNATYFNRLTEAIVRTMSEPTHEGYVFRVDLRLRPQGESGAYARSLDSYVGYYETWGELFDRQALLKARFVAGDRALGAAFLDAVEPFVYQSLVDEEEVDLVLEEISRTKQRIEERIAEKGEPTLHVKLGPGGIRDVEFIVQALQLLHGGHDRALRVAGTLPAIDALRDAGLLDPDDATSLKDAYRFLRRVENFIQLFADRQEYSLPADAEEWERVARRLGYVDDGGNRAGDQFRAELEGHRTFIRDVFRRVFRTEPDPFRTHIDRVLDEEEPSEETRAFLASYGLKDAKAAQQHLRELARGSERVRFTPRVRRAFVKFARPLLEELRSTPDADLALLQLERFLSASKSRAQIYPILQEYRPILELLVRILGTSRFLGDILIREPLLFESLTYASWIEETVETVDEFLNRIREQCAAEPDPLTCVQRFRLGELLRIGTRDILGESDLLSTTRELSLLAEAVLRFVARCVYAELCEKHGEPRETDGSPATWAIIGMGKLAGREINYSSDLDVQFVFSGEGATTGGMPNAEFFQRLARTMVNRMKGPILGGPVYDLDLRLRPHGRGGPMALSLAAYRRYYAEHAEFWERQAAIRARPVAGDPELGERFLEIAWAFAYRAPLTPEEAGEMYHVRERKEDQAAKETSRIRNLKSGYGGLVDIEFLVQALQLREGCENPSLRTQNTTEAIERLRDAGLLDAKEAEDLLDTYVFLRFVEDRLQIVENRPLSALPESEAALDKLARRLGYHDSNSETATERFLAEYHARTERVRAAFEATFERLGAKG